MARFIHKEESEISVEYESPSDVPVTNLTLKNRSATVSGRKLYIVVAVGFGLVCILQAALNISLRLAHNCSDNNKAMIMAGCTNLTAGGDNLKCNLDDVNKLFQQGWVHFNCKFYYISPTVKNWTDSRADCLERGADLVVINSEEEQKLVEKFQRPLWIGLTEETKGIWKWVDGTPLTTSYWDINEPNDYRGGKEDCAEIRINSRQYTWNDSACAELKNWICEKTLSSY